MRRSNLLLLALLCPLFASCVSSFELHPNSPIPKRWASDPRIRGMGALRIVYSSFEPSDRVTATISSRSGRGRFTTHGRWWWDASPEVVARTPAAKLIQIYEFDGIRERYKTVYETT